MCASRVKGRGRGGADAGGKKTDREMKGKKRESNGWDVTVFEQTWRGERDW